MCISYTASYISQTLQEWCVYLQCDCGDNRLPHYLKGIHMHQGLIEPPKAARGHVTSVNGKIQNNVIYRTSFLLLATPDV